jgi:hypothetical protein
MASLSEPFENVFFSVVTSAPNFVDALFRRKFGEGAPDYGHAIVGFYRHDWQRFTPIAYSNFLPHESVILVGGSMTDGEAFKRMPEATAAAIAESGGMYYHLLRFGFDHFADDCEAFFGRAGDPRAWDVGIRAGFEPTQYAHLRALFHRPINEERKIELIEQIHALGPF